MIRNKELAQADNVVACLDVVRINRILIIIEGIHNILLIIALKMDIQHTMLMKIQREPQKDSIILIHLNSSWAKIQRKQNTIRKLILVLGLST